jgi:hypothetical protein
MNTPHIRARTISTCLLVICCCSSIGKTNTKQSNLARVKSIESRLDTLITVKCPDHSAIRDSIQELKQFHDLVSISVLVRTYQQDKKVYRNDALPALIIETLGLMDNENGNQEIISIVMDLCKEGPATPIYPWKDHRYSQALHVAFPLLAKMGKPGTDTLEVVYNSVKAGWGVRVEAKKNLLLISLNEDETRTCKDKVATLVSQLSHAENSWFEGKIESVNNKAIMRALRALGVECIPAIRAKAEHIKNIKGKDDHIAAELTTLADLIKTDNASR